MQGEFLDPDQKNGKKLKRGKKTFISLLVDWFMTRINERFYPLKEH
jgi:hypothetical protein